jgi:hypothetical protein
MRADQIDSGQSARSQRCTAIHGAHLRTLEALFRHPPAHNLEWMDVMALIAKIGALRQKTNGELSFEVSGEHYLMRRPHTKHLTSSEVADLRRFLLRAGWSPATPPRALGRGTENSSGEQSAIAMKQS